MKKINYILPLLLLVLMIIIPGIEIFAQCVGDPQHIGSVGGTPCCIDPVPLCFSCPLCADIPLDGGLSALLVAGVAYGAKRVYGKAK